MINHDPADLTASPSSTGPLVPISAEQQRLWLLDQLEHSRHAHNISTCLQITGELDFEGLTKSFQLLLDRHRVLRSRFAVKNGEPACIDSRQATIELDRVDLTYLSEVDARLKAKSLALDEAQRAFDLQQDLLLRALLVTIRPQEHLLIIVVHQIVCDAPSLNLLVTELTTAYGALASGKKIPLPKLSSHYSDHVVRQKQRSQQGSFEPDLAYWKQRLAGATGTELPSDRNRPAQQSFRGKTKDFVIDSNLLNALRELSKNIGASLEIALCAAFIVLLKRYTGQEDIVIGTEATARDEASAGLIGPFLNNLVLRIDCSGDPTFLDLTGRVSQAWTEAHRHGGLSFERLLEHLHLRRDLSRNPLFQLMFCCRAPLNTVVAGTTTFAPYPMEKGSEALDLTVTVTEGAASCEIRFSYSRDLFDEVTIERMTAQFRTVLGGIASGPNCRVSAIPLLPAAEKHRILIEWNSTAVDYPRDVALNYFIEEQVERTPDAMALVSEVNRLTYRDLNARANQLAHALRRHGVGPDVLVGVCAERSAEMVVGLLGAIKAGGAYVPLDPEYPLERLETMLTDANPAVVLTQEHLLDRLPKTDTPVICLDRDWQSLATESTHNLPVVVNGKNLAYAIYTSGSTGKPKGVPNTHDGIVNRLLWMQDMYKLSPSDRVLQKTPYSFDVSVWEFFWPLMTGARLVLARPGGHKDPVYLVDLIQQEKITTLHFVPSMLSIFLEADGVERCRSIRQVFASGEALPYELQLRFFLRLKAELHNLYGPTEAAVDVTYWKCSPDTDQSVVPIGRPIANTQIYILDANLQPVPTGVAGELHIGGRGLARGYLNRPELTAEKFIRNPFSDDSQARLYKTGDLARFLPDGNIEYLGRIDHQVKLRGFRIELGEIESVLAEDSAVRQAVVTVREDIPGDKRLVAYVVPAVAGTPDFDKLRDHAKSKLPEYMVPSKFVLLERLPMTTSGKVDRKLLPAPQAEQKDHAVIAPRSEMEARLVKIYQRVLGVASVSVTDDFFDLGGHSLMAARMLAEVRHATGKRIPLSVLFQGATPEYLARVIEQGIDMPSEPIAMLIQSGDALAPFFTVVPPGENAVGYMKLARHVGPHQPFYKLQGPGPIMDDRPYAEAELQQLANQYTDAMRAVQPEGPYYFGGLCDGAHIGFRMAQKLEQEGQEIGMFAIFDTWVLENTHRPVLWLVDYYIQRLHHFRRLRLHDQVRTIARNLRNLSDKLVGRGQRSAWERVYWPDENFLAPTINGRITLFKRPNQPYYRLPDPELGWGSRAGGGVDVQIVPIEHTEMLREPHVQILAKKLRERLLSYCAAREKSPGSASYAAVGSESEVS